VSQTTGGVETRFLLDQVQPYQQVALEYRPSGLVVVSYVHGNDLVSQKRDGARSFYHVDGLGSARALTGTAGLVTDRYVYEAFGRTIGETGTTANAYLFAGEQRDGATGLDYLRARYLDPAGGRLLSRDPLLSTLGRPHASHRYLYANGDPVRFRDPTGFFAVSVGDFSFAQSTYSSNAFAVNQSVGRLASAVKDNIADVGLLGAFAIALGAAFLSSNQELAGSFSVQVSDPTGFARVKSYSVEHKVDLTQGILETTIELEIRNKVLKGGTVGMARKIGKSSETGIVFVQITKTPTGFELPQFGGKPTIQVYDALPYAEVSLEGKLGFAKPEVNLAFKFLGVFKGELKIFPFSEFGGLTLGAGLSV
jgi:RHS repeat-associated protein